MTFLLFDDLRWELTWTILPDVTWFIFDLDIPYFDIWDTEFYISYI